MDLSFYQLLILFSFGFAMSLFMFMAFALGAYVVYRAKREAHEPFVKLYEPAGSATQARGEYVHEDNIDFDPPDGGDVDKILYGSPERREKFLRDFVKDVRQ